MKSFLLLLMSLQIFICQAQEAETTVCNLAIVVPTISDNDLLESEHILFRSVLSDLVSDMARITLVDRATIDQVLKDVGSSGSIPDEDLTAAFKAAGARYLLIGRVINSSITETPAIKGVKVTATLTYELRLIDVVTTKVIKSKVLVNKVSSLTIELPTVPGVGEESEHSDSEKESVELLPARSIMEKCIRGIKLEEIKNEVQNLCPCILEAVDSRFVWKGKKLKSVQGIGDCEVREGEELVLTGEEEIGGKRIKLKLAKVRCTGSVGEGLYEFKIIDMISLAGIQNHTEPLQIVSEDF